MKKKKLLCAVLSLGLVASMSSVALAGSSYYSGSGDNQFYSQEISKPSGYVWDSASERNSISRSFSSPNSSLAHYSTMVTSGNMAMGNRVIVKDGERALLDIQWYRDTNNIKMLASKTTGAFTSEGWIDTNYSPR